MGIVESIGWLVIVLGIGLAVLFYTTKKQEVKRYNERLFKYSDKCRALISDFRDSKGIARKMTYTEVERQLHKILEDPKERETAIRRLKEKEKSDWKKDIDYRRQRRKYAYRYEEFLFSLFENNHELSQSVIIDKIANEYGINKEEADDLFGEWLSNRLLGVGNRIKSEDGDLKDITHRLGDTLTSDEFKIDPSDLTFDEWKKIKSNE